MEFMVSMVEIPVEIISSGYSCKYQYRAFKESIPGRLTLE